jgi:uncharacterized membrane protein YhfC
MQPVLQSQPSASWIAALGSAILFEIALPLVLAFIAWRRLGVGWRYFGYGALIFFLFQLISRVPLVQITQALIGPQLRASFALQVAWLALLALTAGLCEEIGRYVGYRWLMRREEKTWEKAIMYGLGHGGLESMLLVGGLSLLTLINLLALPSVIGTLPADQRALVEQQLAAIGAQPDWLPLLAAWERLWSIVFHVALSVVVLQVFRRGNLGWLWLAVLAHALVDFVAVGSPLLLGLQGTSAILLPEVIVTIAGLVGLWAIRALRPPPEGEAVAVGAADSGGPSLAAGAQPDLSDSQE